MVVVMIRVVVVVAVALMVQVVVVVVVVMVGVIVVVAVVLVGVGGRVEIVVGVVLLNYHGNDSSSVTGGGCAGVVCRVPARQGRFLSLLGVTASRNMTHTHTHIRTLVSAKLTSKAQQPCVLQKTLA